MIEIHFKDLLGRITRFRTESGVVETPAFIPVVHPIRELIPPRQIYEEFGCSLIITNAYLLYKAGKKDKVHDLLDYPGSIMTDSGAYQLLQYGDVEITPSEIVKYQESIDSDIAVILDIPTGGYAKYSEAKETVEETLHRARNSIPLRTKSNVLWVGPIQGGTFTDLVAKSAQEIAKLDFPIFAIGSPTQLMEQYQFEKLVNLVLVAKQNLPTHKPVHLFGAGHPMIFPLIVAMGCDMFDSAAYALFARHDRLLTSQGTYRLEEIREDFCYCPECEKYTISELKKLAKEERIQAIARHNLHACFNEIAKIKQAIKEGRLWRLVESKLSSHPALIDAMYRLTNYADFIEQSSPVTKKKALFVTSNWSLFQPEIIRHKNRIVMYSSPSTRKGLFLLAAPKTRPYHSAIDFKRLIQKLENTIPSIIDKFDILFLSPYFGPIPHELSNVYPLSQNEIPLFNIVEDPYPLFELVKRYISKNNQYSTFIGFFPSTIYWKSFASICSRWIKKQTDQSMFAITDLSPKSLSKAIKRILQIFKLE